MNRRKISVLILVVCLIISILNLSTPVYAQKSDSKDYKVYVGKHVLTKDSSYHPSKLFSEKKYKNGEKGVYIIVFSGPICDYMKAGVEKEGAVLKDFMPEHSFQAIMTQETVGNIKKLPYVNDVLVFQPEYKVDTNLLDKLSDTSSIEDTDLVIKFFDSPANLEGALNKIDARLKSKSSNQAVIKAKLSKVKEISEIPEVQYIGIKGKYQIFNNVARSIVLGTDAAWDTYYNGAGEIVAVTDTGLDTGVNDSTMHPDLQGRISGITNLNTETGDTTGDYNGHGTHVAGSIVGTGAASNGKFKGMAPGASLYFQAAALDSDTNGSLSGLPDDLSQLFQASYNAGARTHSNSWGNIYEGFLNPVLGNYTADAATVDDFVWDHKDMTILFAAGNLGAIGDNTITSPATAKNCITVGASENFRPKEDVEDVTLSDDPSDIAYFSSQGPCDDGRIKPDIVSPGTWILSAKSSLAQSTYWPFLQNSSYQYMCGTSMATPITAGVAAAARQYLKSINGNVEPSAALVKAMLINGATDCGSGISRNIQGWGRTNLGSSSNIFSPGFFDDQSINLSTNDTESYTVNVSSSITPIKLALVWTDYPASLNSPPKDLVNDLDLKVTAPDGTTVYYGNGGSSPDRLNNVETVLINNPQIGNYTVEVKGYEVAQGTQNFALCCSHGILGTVSNITATTTTDSINLTWDAVQNATSYNVVIDDSTMVNCSTNSYTHTGLQSASSHTYKVLPLIGYAVGQLSYPATFNTNITTPANLTAASVSSSSINYTWDACTGASWYLIEVEGNLYRTTTNSYLIDNLASNRVYTARVKAFSENNCSDWTSTLQTTTLDSGLSPIPDIPTMRRGLGACESNGKIYAIGGSCSFYTPSYLNTVECFNTATGAWETKSDMITARTNLSVVSAEGKIYAVGGTNGTPLNNLEVYDVNTNTWSTLSNMPTARQSSTAALVNGKIYVIGGSTGSTSCNIVEAYDIATNTWQSCANMPTARSNMSSAIVGNKIYVIGGLGSSSSTVEIYDPSTNTWSTGIPIPTAKSSLSTVTINDRIYVMSSSNNNLIDEFDPATNTWSSKSSIPIKRSNAGAAVYNGKAYLVGGYYSPDGTYQTSCFQYDPAASSMLENLSLPDGRFQYGVAQLKGKIYVSGGYKSYLDTTQENYYTLGATNELLEFDPSTNTWTTKASMLTNRANHEMVALNGKLYAVGGYSPGSSATVLEEYDPATDTWSAITTSLSSRRYVSAIVFNNKIYIFGGCLSGQTPTDQVEEYDPITNARTLKTNMPSAVYDACISQVNGKIYLLSGTSSNYELQDCVQEYDPITDTWTTKNDLGETFSTAGTAVIGNKIYLFGGSDQAEDPYINDIRKNTIKVYDPTAQTLTAVSEFPFDAARGGLTAEALNGRIYVIGGDKISDVNKSFSYNHDFDVDYKDNFAFYNPAWCSDLVLDNLTWTQSPIDLVFGATIRNIGSQATPSSIVHRVHFYVDGSEVSYCDYNTASIAPGQTVTVTANSAWTPVSGLHRITAKVELLSSTHENNTYNNTFEKALPVY